MTDFNIEQIEKIWAVDSIIDRTDLVSDSANQYKLHHKYYKVLNFVKRKLRETQAQKAKLIQLKYDYFSNQIAPQQLKELGWEPNRRVIMKNELERFIDADQDVIDINLQIGNLNDMVEFLESIIRSINQRQFTVKNIIEQNKFLNAVV